ncbi:MAG: acylphosphatase [Candidatus Hydrogenedentes bacterium]|nr:acylphosphatase [Candidatus Hydrogenedentota bacterium]
MTKRLHVYISGRVQGVGFRHWTYIEARSLGLTGWVRNVSGGRVEAEFEGPAPALEQIFQRCHQGPRLAHVQQVQADWIEGEAQYGEFRMRA